MCYHNLCILLVDYGYSADYMGFDEMLGIANLQSQQYKVDEAKTS